MEGANDGNDQKHRAAVPVLLSVVLALSSCGGSGRTDQAGAPGAPTTAPAASPAASEPAGPGVPATPQRVMCVTSS